MVATVEVLLQAVFAILISDAKIDGFESRIMMKWI